MAKAMTIALALFGACRSGRRERRVRLIDNQLMAHHERRWVLLAYLPIALQPSGRLVAAI